MAVEIDQNELMNFIFEKALNDGYPLTFAEIFEVVSLYSEFVKKKLEEGQNGA